MFEGKEAVKKYVCCRQTYLHGKLYDVGDPWDRTEQPPLNVFQDASKPLPNPYETGIDKTKVRRITNPADDAWGAH